MAKGFDYDRFLRGACDPIIAGPIDCENDVWVARVFAHNGIYPRCAQIMSDHKPLCEELRSNAIMQLMRRGANVHVCETQRELQRAAKQLWPANVLAWIRYDVAKSRERNGALSKSSK
ncbi:MAG: hypothetical protein ACR65W_07480 [Methylocystis sp.]|uniref:hypothetical protein n=1 Tax=Methylocystis sp. TaxID=1911079 RepID=UPI003DA6A1D4